MSEHDCPHCGQDLRLPPDAYARIEALEELVEAERDLPLKIEPNYDDPQYTEKHERASLARRAANMPLPVTTDAQVHRAALREDEDG